MRITPLRAHLPALCASLLSLTLICPSSQLATQEPATTGRANPFEPTGNLRRLLTPPAPEPVRVEVPVPQPAEPIAAPVEAAARPAEPAEPVEHTLVLTLFYPNSLDVALAVQNLFGGRVALSLDRSSREEEYAEMRQRFERFDLLGDRLQGTSWGGTGASLSGTGPIDAGLQPSPPPSAAHTGVWPASDKPPIYVSVLQRNNQIAVRSSDAAALTDIESLVRTLDVPTPQVLLEIRVLSLNLGNTYSSAFDFLLWENGPSGAAFTQGTPQNPDGSNNTTGPLIYKYVDDHIRARLTLLQSDLRVSTLATPLLLVANNEVARLFIGEERPIVRNVSSQTTINNNLVTTAPNSSVEIRPVGTTLLLTPNINADRTVTLRIVQEMSDVRQGQASIPIVTATGEVVNQPVDVVGSRSVAGTLVAKDGLTLAIGGLIEEGVGDGNQGIPILKDLPLLGPLFRRENKGRVRRETVVLIRPWVLFTAGEGQQMSASLSGRLLHPSAATEGLEMGTFDAKEAPRAGLSKQPLWEAFKYQSAMPDGQ